MEIISHVRKTDLECQSNTDHSAGVAELASKFAGEFGMSEWGRAMGMLHDKGKEKKDFQNYIRTVGGISDKILHWDDKTHAYVGALLAKKIYGTFAEVMVNQIAGHHAGLYDYPDLETIMTKQIPPEVNCDITKLQLGVDVLKKVKNKEEFNHLWRMLYSCLVDADFLDTERFMCIENCRMRGGTTTMEDLKTKLEGKLEEFRRAPDTTVNRIRRQVQDECMKASSLPSGFFTLTVPTGGGKTISSIVWAVNHAIKNGKKRIIVAIPYTSIIVQTASVLKGIFGEENVLEHHSNIDYDDKDGGEKEDAEGHGSRQKMKLATENWDYPIVVTTNVQLFESIYSNKPSVCRKLHNICNSVLILDEVQTLPTDFLQPIVDALKCYQHLFGVSVLFTTASQPILSGEITNKCSMKFNGIIEKDVTDIITEEMNLHNKLRRMSIVFDERESDYDSIAERLMQHKKVLCIVNTRKDAYEIYRRLPKNDGNIHLSRMMYPEHVSEKIQEMKEALTSRKLTVRVVSTQLIEAGVDIDFPIVYRQIAGLDSILQAAGRCNREGELPPSSCNTFVFYLPKQPQIGSIANGINATKILLLEKGLDFLSQSTMTQYFKILYANSDFDKMNINKDVYKPNNEGKFKINFKTLEEKFKLINDNHISIIISTKANIDDIRKLERGAVDYQLFKHLQKYIVNVSQRDFCRLRKEKIVFETSKGSGIYYVPDIKQYDDQVGFLPHYEIINEICTV